MPSAPHNLVLRYLRRVSGAAERGDVSDADLLGRFLAGRDEAAFELLLWRHGTMVLQVCRDVTRDEHAAEDAFQATFLALVRKAASIRARDSLGAWLYQVAYRVALRARRGGRAAVRIELSEVPAVAELPDQAELHELRPLLHEEIERLPVKYRAPVVLCYLEGLTHAEAARQLGWPKGTVAGRVARARDMLRKRLTRRGVVWSVALAALALAPGGAAASVPAALVQLTLQGVLLVAGDRATAGVVSAHVLALAEGVHLTMFGTKLKCAAALVLLLGLAGGGVRLVAGGQEGREQQAVVQDEERPKVLEPKKIVKPGGAAKEDAPARAQSRENLKMIAIAMHNYHDVNGCFPPAAIYGKDGKPLLSWRVLLLPYLEQDNLYKQFHLDESWDSPHNKKLMEHVVKAYTVPGQKDRSATYYQVFVGEDTIFERRKGAAGGARAPPAGGGGAPGGAGVPAAGGAGGGGPGGDAGGPAAGAAGGAPPRGLGAGMRIADIIDGTSNTLLVVEGGSAVPWTKPEDLPYAPTGKIPPLGGAFKDVIHAAWADGSVVAIKRNFDETALRAAITRNGGEVFDRDSLIDPSPGADEEELKLINARLREEVAEASARVAALQDKLRAAGVALGREADAKDSAVEKLKREQVVLRHQLEELEQQAKQLRDALDRLQRKSPTRKLDNR